MDPIIGGALIGGGASLLGGLFGSRSSKRAAREQVAAQREALAEQRRQYDQTRADFEPYRQFGQTGIDALADPRANFYASPDYEFRRNEGERGLGSSFAARGGAFSGNAMKALAQYNSSLASGEFGNWYNRQLSRAQIGSGATGNLAAMGQNSTNAISNLYAGMGESRAAGTLGAANSILNGLNTGLNLYANSRNRPTLLRNQASGYGGWNINNDGEFRVTVPRISAGSTY